MQISAMRCRAAGAPSASRRPQPAAPRRARRSAVCVRAALKALIFGGEGAIVDADELRRRAYNEAFQHYEVQCGASGGVVHWSPADFAQLQASASGREPETRWYFGRSGWPASSKLLGRAPASEQERAALVEALQEYSVSATERMLSSGDVEARPGVLRLMDEAREAGLAVSVCSGAPKSATDALLRSLLGPARAGALACVLSAGGEGQGQQQEGPLKAAASQMGVEPSECLVVEDGSSGGLKAAMGAGMRCVVTYTPATKWKEFPGAERIVSDLETGEVSVRELQQHRIVQDDRINMTVTDSGVFWSKGGGF